MPKGVSIMPRGAASCPGGSIMHRGPASCPGGSIMPRGAASCPRRAAWPEEHYGWGSNSCPGGSMTRESSIPRGSSMPGEAAYAW
jgi:hypothetical protein